MSSDLGDQDVKRPRLLSSDPAIRGTTSTISRLETVLLTGPCTLDPFLLPCRAVRSAAFIEIHTKDGTVGLGETYAGYFIPEAVPSMVKFHEPILVGQNILEISVEDLARRMTECGRFWCGNGAGAAVIVGIEAALWDLKGKLLGKPVHELLTGGTKHKRLLAYATGGPSNWPISQLLAKIDHYRALGFRGFKVGAGFFAEDIGDSVGEDRASEGINIARDRSAQSPDEIAAQEKEKWRAMREHCGPDVAIMMDAHMANRQPGACCWDVTTAIKVAKAIEEFNPFFLEEPLPYEDLDGYAQLCKATSVPIAGGECLTSVAEFRQFAQSKAFDLVQPDFAFTCGLADAVRVSGMFEKAATHSWGAGGGLMQNIHGAFACPNICIVELVPSAGPLHTEVYGDSLIFEDGYVVAPTAPGLGIQLTESIKRRFPFVAGSGEFNDVPGKVLDDSQLGVSWPGLLSFKPNGQPELLCNSSSANAECRTVKNVLIVSPSDYPMIDMIHRSSVIQSLPIHIMHPFNHQDLEKMLPEAHAVIWVWPPDAPTCDEITWTDHSGSDKIGALWPTHAKSVEMVHVTAHGVNHVPLHDFPPDLTLTNSKGAFGSVVAEFALWGCLHFAKCVDSMQAAQREGRWFVPTVSALRGCQIGVIGFGSIGSEVANLALAFGMHVTTFRRHSSSSIDQRVMQVTGRKGLELVLKQSDYLVITAPLTPETRDLIGSAELSLMKSSSVLVNVGRGEIVDEAALIAALKNGVIKGAVLEVFRQEPLPAGHELYGMPNVVVAAHCADSTEDQLEHTLRILEKNLARFVKGMPLINVCDKAAGY